MHTFSRSSQKGFSLLEVLLAVSIAIALGSMQLGKIKRETESIQAKAVGEQLRMVGGALNDYVALHYNNLVDLTSVTAPGTAGDPGPRTCNAGTGLCTVTSDTLRRNGLLPASFSGRNAYGATYEYYIRVSGSAPNWQIDGIVVTSDPYAVGGLPRFDLIGQAMGFAGADSGTTRVLPNRMDGYNGAWQESGYPINQVGLLGYRVGYGTSGFVSYLRIDGSNHMTGTLKLSDGDIANNQNIEGARNITASETIQGRRLSATSLGPDAITLPGSRTIGSSEASGVENIRIASTGGVEITTTSSGGTPASLVAGDTTLANTATQDLTTNDITAGGSVVVMGQADFRNNVQIDGGVRVVGSYESADGNILLTNGNVTTDTGTISAHTLIAGTSTFRDDASSTQWTMGRWGGGWYMNDTTWMRVTGDKNINTGGEIRAGTLRSTGNTIVNHYLQIQGAQAIGDTCSVGTEGSLFSRDTMGRMLQCVGGTWRLTSGLSNVSQVASSNCSNGATCVANCPAGTRLTGGGGTLVTRVSVDDPTGPAHSNPDTTNNRWVVLSQPTNRSTFQAYAICAN